MIASSSLKTDDKNEKAYNLVMGSHAVAAFMY